MNRKVKKPIVHSAECNINGYGYCDCGADKNRYLSESDVTDIVNNYKEVTERLEETVKSLLRKEWIKLSELEIAQTLEKAKLPATFSYRMAAKAGIEAFKERNYERQ